MSSGCKCGSNCRCEMYVEKSSSVVMVEGVAPLNNMNMEGGDEKSFGAEGCKCGTSCSCDPCNC